MDTTLVTFRESRRWTDGSKSSETYKQMDLTELLRELILWLLRFFLPVPSVVRSFLRTSFSIVKLSADGVSRFQVLCSPLLSENILDVVWELSPTSSSSASESPYKPEELVSYIYSHLDGLLVVC